MSAGTRASQASPLGHVAQGAARAPLRAAVKVALAPRATAPPALTCQTLRSARLQRSTTRISESSAALQTWLRERRLQNAAESTRHQHALVLRARGRGSHVLLPSRSTRAMPRGAAGLDTAYAYSYVASNSRTALCSANLSEVFVIMLAHANSLIPSNSEGARHVAPKLGWTLNDLAHSLSVSVPFLRLEIKRGRLRAAHFGRRVVVLDPEVRRYLAEASSVD